MHPRDNSRTHDSKKTRPLEEKESFRWVQTLGSSTVDIPSGVHLVTVCDREGDMYELFDAAARANQPFLILAVISFIATAVSFMSLARSKPNPVIIFVSSMTLFDSLV
jgi:hypothetical protein